jgi:hypothetical protein
MFWHPVAALGRAPTEIVHRRLDLTVLTPDDRSSFAACLRRFRAGGEFALCLHAARLVDRVGGGASAPVIRSLPQSGREAS